jgi:predicted permease
MNPDLHEFVGRLKCIFRRKNKREETAEELEFHQSLLRERLSRQGMPQSQIDAAARRTFGNVGRWQEQLNELWQFHGVENFLRDVGFSARLLRKSPGFTMVAVLTLALGVGANAAVFSMIHGLLLRSLDVPNADQLVVLRVDDGPNPSYDISTPLFRGLERRDQAFAQVFAFNPDTLQVQGRSGNENVPGVLVSGKFFDALETPPLLGRYLTPADDQRGGNPEGLAVVISESFWERWFDRAPDAVGRKLVIANVPFTVAGVMPKRFIGADPTLRPEIFAPLSADPIIDAPRNHIDDGISTTWLTMMGRLKPNVTLDEANAELVTISEPILQATEDADYIAQERKAHFHYFAEPGSKGFTYARSLFRKPLVAMGLMCGGVLLLGCLNLASLLLARGRARSRELATRLALGGSRRRLMQQLLVESMLIAMLGTAAGVAIGATASRSLAALLMSGNRMSTAQLYLDTSLDVRWFGFAALTAGLSTLLMGLLPAWRATAREMKGHNCLNEQIREGHFQQTPRHQGMLPRVLISAEIGLALVIVTGAGLLATSVIRLVKSGTGFEPKGLMNIAFNMDKQQLEGDALMQVYQQIGEGLTNQPGVKGVSFEFIVPLSNRGWNGSFSAPGSAPRNLDLNSVAPAYFKTMRIPLREGREFRWTDTKASGRKIILNESAAQLLFPGRSAVGQQVANASENSFYEVVAVVGDAKYRDLRSPAPAAGYVPIQQDESIKPSLNAVVRVDGPIGPVLSATRSLTARLAPAIPAPVLTTADEMVNRSISAERLMAILSSFFAVCALLVTAVGLYGTLAYSTARRTSEIGIRMALGARRAGIIAMIFRENLLVAAMGCGAGLMVALLVTETVASLLYGISPHDPWVLMGSVAALMLTATVASLLPALRAARIDPVEAIRYE